MPRNPQEYLRFLADNYRIIEAMCSHRRRFASEEEIATFLRHYDAEDRSQTRKISRMQELRILICGASEWSPPAFLVSFINQLHDHHALATPEVIRGWVHALDKCVREIETLIEPAIAGTMVLDTDSASFLLDQIRGTFHAIVGNVEESCDRIAREVANFRALEEASRIRSRLRRLVVLHDDYLDPVVRIVDIDGEFHAVTDRAWICCSRLLVLDENEIQDVARIARSMRRDLVWMRRQVLQRAHEAKSELGPLCEAAVRESRIAKGVNRAMEAIRAGDWDRLDLATHLPIIDQKIERLFSDRGVRRYIRLAAQAREQEPPRLPPDVPREEKNPWSVAVLIEALETTQCLEDLLVWIQERCPGIGPDSAFNLLRRIIARRPENTHSSREYTTYQVDCLTVTAARWTWGEQHERNTLSTDR